MIEKIQIENFKCFDQNLELKLNDITLLSGLNSSGKSSVYQILLLLQQSNNKTIDYNDISLSYLKLNDYMVQLGKAEEIINDKSKPLKVFLYFSEDYTVKFSYTIEKRTDFMNDESFDDRFLFIISELEIVEENYSCKFVRNGKKFTFEATKCMSFYDNDFLNHCKKYVKSRLKGTDIVFDESKFADSIYFSDVENVNFYSSILRTVDINLAHIATCFDDSIKSYLDSADFSAYLLKHDYFDDTFTLEFGGFRIFNKVMNMSNLCQFIPPFRGYPKRLYVEMEEPNPLSLLIDSKKRKVNYNIVDGEIISGNLLDAVNYWFRFFVGKDNTVKINNMVDGLVTETVIVSNQKTVSLNNMGFGMSQLLPLILKILRTSVNSLCVIDEPETHLHPGVQSKISDFIYTMSKLGKKIIVETHSEYIINKLIYYRLIDGNNNIAMYWVENTGKNSNIYTIEYDELGYIKNHPPGFVDENSNIVDLLSEVRTKRL